MIKRFLDVPVYYLKSSWKDFWSKGSEHRFMFADYSDNMGVPTAARVYAYPAWPKLFQKLALVHELGHLMGEKGTPYPWDIMFETGNEFLDKVGVFTLQWWMAPLYRLFSGKSFVTLSKEDHDRVWDFAEEVIDDDYLASSEEEAERTKA